ncbi:type II toxin-antitoxin system VapC family toxin [uncultured Methanobrevibacter sp.]|uniref:type II toxin-antitoxin system VapC family toxin n=2 Tax=uncultured Methanobrevibacter sp. TaxID=253161 RepID=UPI0025E2A580|nr:type II toxin-antitoxin system VapC family toxin [uncultured Methanobrevibacter sp.]
MIFLDTSYINSLIIKNDPYRQYAKNIKPLLEKEAKITNITVLIEVFNSISPYNFFGDVNELKNYLLNIYDFDFLTEEDYERAFEFFNYYNRSVNFSDCTILVSMQKHGIGRIASFDADFDKISGFERIH